MTDNENLEEIIGISGYLLSSPGVGGEIKSVPEDFVVREILPNGSIILDGSEIGNDVGGMYTHFVLWKRGIDTYSAIKKIGRICNHKDEDFSFAGLKDAQAESFQRVSVWVGKRECLEKVNLKHLKIINPIRQKFAISLGDLVGNHFQVVIRNTKKSLSSQQWENFRKEAESTGFLNFFGLQRFGSKRPILHLVGKHILREEYSKAIDVYLGSISEFEHEKITRLRQSYNNQTPYGQLIELLPPTYLYERIMLKGLNKKKTPERIVQSLPKYFSRLAISAYQGFIFNRILQYLHKQKDVIQNHLAIPVVGYSTDITTIDEDVQEAIERYLSMDGLSPRSFKHKIKHFSSKGTTRYTTIQPKNLKLLNSPKHENTIQLAFELPRGSYATMFLRELTNKSC